MNKNNYYNNDYKNIYNKKKNMKRMQNQIIFISNFIILSKSYEHKKTYNKSVCNQQKKSFRIIALI